MDPDPSEPTFMFDPETGVITKEKRIFTTFISRFQRKVISLEYFIFSQQIFISLVRICMQNKMLTGAL